MFDPQTDIPSLQGKVILVTGGTDGLGKQTVLQLASHAPARVYLAARSPAKAHAAIADIQAQVGVTCAPIEFLHLDLSSLDSVKKAATQLSAAEARLDLLIANAGVMGTSGVTQEDYEMQFGVNHMGHALLIRLLLPRMQQTAQRDDIALGETRCVVLASEAEKFAPSAYPYHQLKGADGAAALGVIAKYGFSKRANVHYTAQLARHFPEAETGVRFVAIHPGGVKTNLGDLLQTWPRTQNVLRKVAGVLFGLVSVEEGAWGQLWAATWPVGKTEGIGEPKSGEFYYPVGVAGKGSASAYNEDQAKELWEWTEKELQPFYQN